MLEWTVLRSRADPVVGGDGCAHALGTVLREALDVLARVERRVRQQQRSRLRALAAAPVPPDLDFISHKFLLNIKAMYFL